VSDVALVAMPFAPVLYPSIGLSLLQPALARRGFSSRCFYFTLDYAERMGMRFYTGISQSRRPPLGKLPGEWIFGGQLWDRTPEDIDRYVGDILKTRLPGVRRARRPIPKRVIDRVVAAEADAGAFVAECVDKLLRHKPRIVALTSVFQQHAPSLALARRLKEADPSILTVMGGSNCEAEMGAETCRQFPWIDAVVSGEGDLTFPELVRRMLAGEPFDDMPGVYTRSNIDRVFAEGKFETTPPVLDMDALPECDYGDYLAAFRRTRFFRDWQPRLLFESSRGCWWGERMHCTFCGLNGSTMKYRSKSPERALREMQSIAERHPGYDVDVTDNIIDLGYFDSVLPQLARLRIKGMDLFYETKSNLRKQQVRAFREARIMRIQPGIESLSDAVLKIMRKGVTGLQNIQLLKWGKEYGVWIQWNLLAGFPGERAEEYERMTRFLPLLSHLTPPEMLAPIRMDRFSPNFFDAERLGFANVRPFEAYRHVYNLSGEALFNLACFFRFDYAEEQNVESYFFPLLAAVEEWQHAHARSALFSIDAGDHLIIWDLRPVAKQLLTVLSDLDRRLYLACDEVRYVRQLATLLGTTDDAIENAVAPLIEHGLMLRDGDRLLSLAIPVGDYAPNPEIVDRFRNLTRKPELRPYALIARQELRSALKRRQL
jgi:ribosomal peptide maturation radical SAM protein 1